MLWPVPGTIVTIALEASFTRHPVVELLPPAVELDQISQLCLSYYKAPRRPSRAEDEAASRLLTAVAITYGYVQDLLLLYDNLGYVARWLVSREMKLTGLPTERFFQAQDPVKHLGDIRAVMVHRVLEAVHFAGDAEAYQAWRLDHADAERQLIAALQAHHNQRYGQLERLYTHPDQLLANLPRELTIAQSCDPLADPKLIIPQQVLTSNYYH